MAATITSFASGVSITGGTLGASVAVIPTQSDIRTNGSNTGIVVSTPSGNIYNFTNDDMGASNAAEAAIVLLNALNGTPMQRYSIIFTAAANANPVISKVVENTIGTVAATYSTGGSVLGEYALLFTFPSGTFTNYGKVKVAANLASNVSSPVISGWNLDGTDKLYVYGIRDYAAGDYMNEFGSTTYGMYCNLEVTVLP